MEYLKFFIFAAFLLFGILAQRFQRHVITSNDIENGILIDGLNDSFPDIPNELAADQLPGVQEGDDVRLNGYGEIPIELNNGQLKFEFCSDGCMEKRVVVCYDTENTVSSLRGECESKQCEFQASVSKASIHYPSNFLWLMLQPKAFSYDICETAILKSPEARLSFSTPTPAYSCEPLKRDGNIIKLFVRAVPSGCRLKIKNAKIWVPTTPSATTPESATTEDPSKIGSIVWIILGIVLFILVIGFISLGIYCFCIKKQKKPATIFDEKPNEILAENKKVLESQKISENIGNGKSEKPKEAVKTEKERTEEKQENVESVNQKKDVEKPKQKATKKKVDVQATLKEATTEASIVQAPKKEKHFPSARVSKELIHPVPKSHVKKVQPRNGQSNITDSLSGRHEVGMLALVESPSESFKRY